MHEIKATAASAAEPALGREAASDVMTLFDAYRSANDERLQAVERKAADPLLGDKVDRIEAALSAAERRLERMGADSRRPSMGGAASASAERGGGRAQGGLRRLPARRSHGRDAGAEGPVGGRQHRRRLRRAARA